MKKSKFKIVLILCAVTAIVCFPIYIKQLKSFYSGINDIAAKIVEIEKEEYKAQKSLTK